MKLSMKWLLSIICIILPWTLMASAKVESSASKNDKVNNYFKTISKNKSGQSVTEADQLLPEEKSQLSESEIPIVLTEKKEKAVNEISSFQRMIFSLVFLLVLSFAILIWIQRRGKKGPSLSGARNIKILSQKSIGPKKELMIIRIAGETILLGVTENNINPIKTLSLLDDEIPALSGENFSEELADKLSTNFHEKEPTKEKEYAGFEVSQLQDVKDIVTRRFS